ncbi:MAG: hypothetical protein QOH91_2318, partial [Mycobacterium sp.]|nr:hypothetical protein [Mycobacterium sp.]
MMRREIGCEPARSDLHVSACRVLD